MHGEPALPPDFKHLPYANPDAPQGGQLRQAVTGSFDSVNPFIVKGTPAVNVRTYVFESLLGRNWDEPFSLYGLLAETIDVSDDRQTFTFKLRPEAKFSDGTPVTAADVVFSVETLRDKGRPNFKNVLFEDHSDRNARSRSTIIFTSGRGRPRIAAHRRRHADPLQGLSGRAGSSTRPRSTPSSDRAPMSSARSRPGEAIIFRKNPGLLGQGPAHRSRGLWNFDEVRFDYYRDANAAFEAFKKGDGRCPHRGRPDALGHGL